MFGNFLFIEATCAACLKFRFSGLCSKPPESQPCVETHKPDRHLWCRRCTVLVHTKLLKVTVLLLSVTNSDIPLIDVQITPPRVPYWSSPSDELSCQLHGEQFPSSKVLALKDFPPGKVILLQSMNLSWLLFIWNYSLLCILSGSLCILANSLYTQANVCCLYNQP